MNIKKYLMLGGVALSLGLSTTSCVGDLDLEPIDPSQTSANTSSMEFIQNSFAQCYANLGFCSTNGPGESNLSVPDAGASVYVRLLFALNEMTTDEAFWIWKDNGLYILRFGKPSDSHRLSALLSARGHMQHLP